MYRPSNERYSESSQMNAMGGSQMSAMGGSQMGTMGGSQMGAMGSYPPISNLPKMHMLDGSYPPPPMPVYYDPSQPYDFVPPQQQNPPS
jgi:hypothetical protein